MTQKHRDEKLVDMLVEAFEYDLVQMLKYATTDDGRLMFQKRLSSEEQLGRYLHIPTRVEVEAGLARTGGVKAVQQYRDRMDKLVKGIQEG